MIYLFDFLVLGLTFVAILQVCAAHRPIRFYSPELLRAPESAFRFSPETLTNVLVRSLEQAVPAAGVDHRKPPAKHRLAIIGACWNSLV